MYISRFIKACSHVFFFFILSSSSSVLSSQDDKFCLLVIQNKNLLHEILEASKALESFVVNKQKKQQQNRFGYETTRLSMHRKSCFQLILIGAQAGDFTRKVVLMRKKKSFQDPNISLWSFNWVFGERKLCSKVLTSSKISWMWLKAFRKSFGVWKMGEVEASGKKLWLKNLWEICLRLSAFGKKL